MSEQLELFDIKDRSRITVSEAFELLWEYHMAGKPSSRTYLGNRKAVCRSFGGRYFDTLTFIDVSNHKKTRPPGAAFHDHGLISLLFNVLSKWKRTRFKSPSMDFSGVNLPPENPTSGLKRGSPGSRSRVITPVEFAKLAEHAPSRLLEVMILRLDTGLRETDLKRLLVEHLNRFNSEIEIDQSKTGRRISIPATPRVRKLFEKAEKQGREFVCDFTGIEHAWKRTRKLANLPDVQRRDLRRSGPSWSYAKFPDFNLMGEFLGHGDPRSTRRYVVIRRDQVRKIVHHISKEYAEK